MTQCVDDCYVDKGALDVILDRRLNQDDWRGLKQGVLDNVPTTSSFLLAIEQLHQTLDANKVFFTRCFIN